MFISTKDISMSKSRILKALNPSNEVLEDEGGGVPIPLIHLN